MTDPDQGALVSRYKACLVQVLGLRKALGELPPEQEARLAQERLEIWEQLDASAREVLEDWIDGTVRPES